MDFGTDIRLVKGDFSAGVDGDLEMVSNIECLIQDIQHEAMTYPGDLFYDVNYGYGLQDFIQSQATDINRQELIQRITSKLVDNELIEQDTVIVTAQTWTLENIVTNVRFSAYDENIQLSIKIETEQITVEVVST